MAGLKAGLLAQSSRVAEDVYLLAPEHVDMESDEEEADEDDGDRLIIRP
jgi:FtsZ-interacting cell division protein YlmF